MTRKSILTFGKYTCVSTALFLFELALFVFLIHYTPLHYVLAAITTFMIGVTLQYAIIRRFVFGGAGGKWQKSYLLFAVSAGACVALIALLMLICVEMLGMPETASRIVAGIAVGYAHYLFNLYAIFKKPESSYPPSIPEGA